MARLRYSDAVLREIQARAKTVGKEPTIGQRICAIVETRCRRRGQAVNLYTLLESAGIHQSVYARWRKGETNPSMTVVERLESVGISVF